LEDRFDAKGATALKQDGFPAVVTRKPGDFEQPLPDGRHERIEFEVPGPSVMQHRLLNTQARG
jgi:hypothetical protein